LIRRGQSPTPTMNDANVAFSSYSENRKENEAPDWLDQLQPCTGTGGLERTHSSEEKFHNSPQAQIIRRKTRRKEDGPLAICCRFVVEHQIGKFTWEFDYRK